jgi:hypothetical protein
METNTTNTSAPKIKISVQYVTRYTKRNEPYLKAIVRCTDEDAEYRHDAEDFIETGCWGALDEENNQHLVKYRDRYVQKVTEFGYQFRSGYAEWE